MAEPAISKRKDEHLAQSLGDVESDMRAGVAAYDLEYDALPEIDLDAVDLKTPLLGQTLKAPLVIGAMTGGSEAAFRVNALLARAAAHFGIGMALGSGRAALLYPELLKTYAVREVAPVPLVLANLGAVQLKEEAFSAGALSAFTDAIGADALELHLNPLQEAIQPGGDSRFSGVLQKIEAFLEGFPKPVLIKEVGSGISQKTAQKLARLKIAGLETAGLGGTSFTKIEAMRADPGARKLSGLALSNFGIQTADSILACRKALGKDRLVIASGGIRSALDAAKALALGADAVAMARPFLKAAQAGEEALFLFVESFLYALRTICFACGCVRPADLHSALKKRDAARD